MGTPHLADTAATLIPGRAPPTPSTVTRAGVPIPAAAKPAATNDNANPSTSLMHEIVGAVAAPFASDIGKSSVSGWWARSRTIRGVDQWLTAARDALAEAASVSPEELDLDDEDAGTLLDLARIAAHVSGERTNAPLLCYLVGRAQGDATLDDLAAAVRSTEA